MSTELDLQQIAEDMIVNMQKLSKMHAEQSQILKWKAEGVMELHDAIRREAERIELAEQANAEQHPGVTSEPDGC